MKIGREEIPLKVTSEPYILSRSFSCSKMAAVQTFEVDARLAPVNMGPR
jgi:hypothetical protein